MFIIHTELVVFIIFHIWDQGVIWLPTYLGGAPEEFFPRIPD